MKIVTTGFAVLGVLAFGLPAPGADFTGDGTNDVGIFRPSTGLWAIRGVTRVYFGTIDDKPVPGDYNGDGTSEIAIFRDRSGLWAVRDLTRVYFGNIDDIPLYGGSGGRGPEGPPGTNAWDDGYGNVTTSGRVGIGVSDPQYPLDVNGQIVGRFTPGNLILGVSPNGGTRNTQWTKAAEFMIGQGGAIRVEFTLNSRYVDSWYRAYGRIYVNGIPKGTERDVWGEIQTFTEEIGGLNPGDRIQLYLKSSDSEQYASYTNFQLKIGAGIFCTYIPPVVYY
jgi:hypothetical protein